MDWANEEIILSTLKPIMHLTSWVMVTFPLSHKEFNQVNRFRTLIGEYTFNLSRYENCKNHRTTSGGIIHDYLNHLKKSSENAFRESEKLRIPLQSLLNAISALQN